MHVSVGMQDRVFHPSVACSGCLQALRYEDAEADCDAALKLDLNVKALLRRGMARMGLNKYDGARKDFNQVLALEPRNRCGPHQQSSPASITFMHSTKFACISCLVIPDLVRCMSACILLAFGESMLQSTDRGYLGTSLG